MKQFLLPLDKLADLSPIHFRKTSATDGTKPDLNIGETWGLARLDESGPNPTNPVGWCKSSGSSRKTRTFAPDKLGGIFSM